MVQNRVPNIISVPRLKLDVGSKSTQLKIPPKLNCHFEPHHICDTFFNGLKMCKIYSPPNFPVILHPIKFERTKNWIFFLNMQIVKTEPPNTVFRKH